MHPTTSVDDLIKFLEQKFSPVIQEIKPLVGGEQSKAYSFTSQGKQYVIRINRRRIGFDKDKYASDCFSMFLPIPKILDIGEIEDRYYCISEQSDGEPFQKETPITPELLKDIIQTLQKIHKIDIPTDSNYGVINRHGAADFKSWRDWVLKDYILVFKDDESYYKWTDIYQREFVNKETIDNLFQLLNKYVVSVPSNKNVIHGDYGPGNILINKDQVTSIIDWSESAYGDPLYDVAWFDFWVNQANFKEFYKDFRLNDELADYNDRIYAHQLFIGLHSLGIYASINYADGYNYTLKKVEELLTHPTEN